MPETPRTPIDAVLIGGNHLATILILAFDANIPSYKLSPEEAMPLLREKADYIEDVWYAWRAIMLLRDSDIPAMAQRVIQLQAEVDELRLKWREGNSDEMAE